MAALHLTPYATAKKAGLGGDYVRDLMRGKVKEPSAARLDALARALECEPAWLLGIGMDIRAGKYGADQADIEAEASSMAEAAFSDDTYLVTSLLEQMDSALRDAMRVHLPKLDREDETALFGTHKHRGDISGRVFLAHALGVIHDVERATLLFFSELAERARKTPDFSLDAPEEMVLVNHVIREALGDLVGEMAEAKRPLLGIVASTMSLTIRSGAQETLNFLEGEASRIRSKAASEGAKPEE